MSVWYMSDCMVSIININNGIREPTCGDQNYNTSQKLIFGGYGEVRVSLHTQFIIWVNIILKPYCTSRKQCRIESRSVPHCSSIDHLDL